MRKLRDWPIIFRDWETSGLSAQAYCREHGLSPSSFWQWRKRLGKGPKEKRTLTRPVSDFIDVTPSVAKPIKKPVSMLRIILPSGCQIEVPL